MKQNQKKQDQNKTQNARNREQTFIKPEQKEIPSDVLGSYTGTGHDGERPIQDADDL